MYPCKHIIDPSDVSHIADSRIVPLQNPVLGMHQMCSLQQLADSYLSALRVDTEGSTPRLPPGVPVSPLQNQHFHLRQPPYLCQYVNDLLVLYLSFDSGIHSNTAFQARRLAEAL